MFNIFKNKNNKDLSSLTKKWTVCKAKKASNLGGSLMDTKLDFYTQIKI